MDDSTYTLEWRGTRTSGYSYEAIEAALVTGELHSMYKIHANGRWQVLRDYLEQYRAQYAAAQAAYGSQNQQPAAQPLPQPARHQSLPSYDEAMAEPAQPQRPAPAQQRSAPLKPAWFWPAIILSGTACLLLALVVVYLLASSHFSSQRTTSAISKASTAAQTADENKPEDKPRKANFQPVTFTGKEIFPSLIISTATVDWNGDAQTAEDKKTDADAQIRKHQVPIYGDENGWIGVKLEGLKKGAEVTVEIKADSFMKPSKWHGKITTLSEKGSAMFSPKILWDYEALSKARQQRPMNVIFSASIDDQQLPEINETYTLRSINDCPYLIKGRRDEDPGTRLNYMFAAYVNENHPQVQEILKEALECHIVDLFDGYQSNDAETVLRQVWAIWNALQRRGIKYSSVTTTTPSDSTYCQTVRFIDQSIEGHQANCVDGSVLMASVLQKIGIKSYLVLIPGHCFLAFDTVKDNTALPTGLETTLLGENDITEVKSIGLLPRREKDKEYEASQKTFINALNSGSKKIQSCARSLQSSNDPGFALISIEDSRNMGIMPIPFASDK